MNTTRKKSNEKIQKLVMGGILSALVIILQYLGSFIKFGPFSVSLVLIPIVIGAAMCGPIISAWLGLLFGVIVLATGDASVFLAINAPGTVATVLLKGALAGLFAGIVYKLLSKVNTYFAVVISAIVCPFVNTGIFLLGCRLFFYETVASWGADAGYLDTTAYMFLGLVGANFLFEIAFNIVLSPIVVRLLKIKIK